MLGRLLGACNLRRLGLLLLSAHLQRLSCRFRLRRLLPLSSLLPLTSWMDMSTSPKGRGLHRCSTLWRCSSTRTEEGHVACRYTWHAHVMSFHFPGKTHAHLHRLSGLLTSTWLRVAPDRGHGCPHDAASLDPRLSSLHSSYHMLPPHSMALHTHIVVSLTWGISHAVRVSLSLPLPTRPLVPSLLVAAVDGWPLYAHTPCD